MNFFGKIIKQESLATTEDPRNKLIGLNVNVKIENETDYYENIDWLIQNDEIDSFKIENCSNKDMLGYEQLRAPSVIKCSICDSCFFDHYDLAKHNLTHLKVLIPWMYECNECPNIYLIKESLESHIKDTHLSIKDLRQCAVCKKKLKYKSWHSHIKEVHGPRVHECKECKFKFKSARYLKRHHLHKHEGVKPPWRFYRKSEDGISSCNICSAKLPNKHSLKTHMRNCHSESVTCHICKSKLKSKSYLLTHIRRVHYDDGKSHDCDICGKSFKSPRYLRVHQKHKGHLKKS